MIRFAREEDVGNIMQFIHDEWKKDHILSSNESFFRYEHQNGANINFVISTDTSDQVNGILGFIPASSSTTIDICTVMWKVAKGVSNPILGVNLLEFLVNSNKFRTVMSVGINEKTIGIYNFLGFYTGRLNHYVLLNHTIKDFKIAVVEKKFNLPEFVFDGLYKLREIDTNFEFDFSKFSHQTIYKDSDYFIKRYFKHPIFKYHIFGVVKGEQITSLIVTRIQEAEGSRILRIVDFIGQEEELKYVSGSLYQYLIDNNLEYADFYSFGLKAESLISSNFQEVELNSNELIIPNYFSPFTRKNIKINFFTNSQDLNTLKIFKADGDQDRPN